MAYDQYGNYPQQQQPYYNQPPPPRGGSRGPPQAQQRGQEPYAYPQAGYSGQDRYQQQQPGRVESYHGYDDVDILDQYGGDEQDQQGYSQQYQQASSYGDAGRLQSRPPPQQYREPPQRRDYYGPPPRGYGPPMGGPGGQGRGPPPRGYPPQQRGGYAPQQGFVPPRRAQTAPQGYDDARHYQQFDDQAQYQRQTGYSPPRQNQRERLLNDLPSPKSVPFDNPFPTFPSGQASKPMNDAEIAERAMAGIDLNERTSLESRRPPTSSSQNSMGVNSRGQPVDPRTGAPPRTSNEGYRPDPTFAPPQRSMTMPQNFGEPGSNRSMSQNSNAIPPREYNDGGLYGRQPPPERSTTSVGDMRGPARPPDRPSTATGTRPQGNGFVGPRNNPSFNSYDQAPPSRNFMPNRPGTSQGYRDGPGPMQRPGTSQGYRDGPGPMQRAPMSKEAQIDAYMPDFDSAPAQTRPLQDAIGLPLDAAPEASKPLQNSSHDLQKARSQPNLRSQANGYGPNSYPQEPVPEMPPIDTGGYGNQRREAPRMLLTDPAQMSRPQAPPIAGPNSPRQFHRPGAPPIVRAGTTDSGWSDPGPGRTGTPNSVRTGAPVKPVNPDALPPHPTPVRPGLSNTRMGAADIRQQQASRMSAEQPSTGRAMSGPVTVQELFKLREAVKSQPQNQAQALHLAKKLVEAAVVLADENGAADARTTQRNRENYVNEAYKLVKKLVAANYPEAMFYLADCHGTGELGVSIDPKEAFVLYQSAAKLGHGQSAYRTAVCCEMGQENGGGTRKDPLKAVQWYRRGAALGDVPAMYKLGMILLKGLMGTQANLGEAMIWLQRASDAADAENPHALHELAGIYENAPPGGKVIRDEAYALELYTKAAKFGYRNSQSRLGTVYEYGQLGCVIDQKLSIYWYSKAAAQEDHDAELALSGWYLTGSPGILEQSDQEAYLWARKAALAEHPKAEFAMGYFSETGIGCPKSFEDAKRWYGRAAGHRYPKARERLEELTRGGQKGMKNKERISRSDPKKQEECIVM
ncbi:uncharacterized protein PV09_08722 [Verruconis gallopava]|uniref:Uncharacterized protein n=1 Tax=Verruconis gallopava TaxID=253628 RepID=A0A0D1ZZ11_9PEZI|nr:uncharacterized protein PV09_08722 [Verruconis gallopava]KIV99667.1 hypothetical protein PV09_08722 [Verruconis gallopava]